MKAILSGSLVGLALTAALVPALKTAPTPEPSLEAVRAATTKYKDVNVALDRLHSGVEVRQILTP